MVRRVCREFGNKRGIIVLNDEAHHCYRRRRESASPEAESGEESDPKLKGDERKEAEKRNEEARVWISGLEAIKAEQHETK